MSRLTHLIGHELTFEVVFHGIFQSEHLCIAEAMIYECRIPPTSRALLSIADIIVSRNGCTKILAIEFSLLVQFLCKYHADGVANVASHLHTKPTGNILSEINDI